MSRVVMFVLNDVRRDARVLREAGSLVAAGHAVTVIGRPTGASAALERETRDGIEILRVPVPGAIRRALLDAGGGRSRRGGAGDGGGDGTRRSGPRIGALRGVVGIVRMAARVPLVGGLVSGLDWLVRWRFGTLAWASAAAVAAPDADVWLAHDLTGLPAALAARRRLRGGRLIYDMHELYVEAGDTARRPGWARALIRRWERRAIAESDAVVTVNTALADVIRSIATPTRLVVMYNAPPRRPASDPAASPLRAATGLNANVPIVLYHGAFAPGRGLEVLAAAIREPALAAVHAIYLGEGDERSTLDRAAADPASAGRIHILPAVDPLDVPEWVAGADVAVMPIAPTTRNHRLSTPNKLFEALAAGVPIVASEFPAIGEIVLGDPDGPLGALCDPTSPRDVARAITSILDRTPGERKALRRRCLEAAHARWNWETEGAKLVALVAELTDRPAPPTAAPTREDPVAQRLTIVLPSTGEFDSRSRRIAIDLGTRGHDVLVIARQAPGLPDAESLSPGARLVRVDAGDPPSAVDRAASAANRAAAEARRIIATALRTRTQARAAEAVDRPAAEPADVVHAMGFLGLPVALHLARRSHAPLVYDARDIYAQSTNVARLPGLLRGLFELSERLWAGRAARVITVNEACAEYLERSLGVPRPAIVMNGQPAWTPPSRRPNRLRRAVGLPAATKIVLYHGGFMPDRGLPELIAAMAEPGLERAHLVLLGSGAIEPDLRRVADESPATGRVHVLPPVPPLELLDWVASADVGAMPNQPRTLNERLSTPNKLFECLAAGTPVVSSDFRERRRIIVDDLDGPLGAVCDPTDIAALGVAIRSILELDRAAAADLRSRCARAARARYAWEPQLRVLLEEYGRLTGRPW